MEDWERNDIADLYYELLGYDDYDDMGFFGVWPVDGSNDDIDDFGDF